MDGDDTTESIAALRSLLGGVDVFLQGADLPHLIPTLTPHYASLDALLSTEITRPELLANLKAHGVERLSDRQKLANAVSRAQRKNAPPADDDEDMQYSLVVEPTRPKSNKPILLSAQECIPSDLSQTLFKAVLCDAPNETLYEDNGLPLLRLLHRPWRRQWRGRR